MTHVPFSAENGCFVSLPERQNSEPLNGRVWHKLVSGVHESWRQPVLEILRYYTERTPGSMIDDRGISIVWRYANTTEDQNPDSRRASIASATDDGSSEDLHSEAPIYKDGVGNEAYHWARRQAAEVQNHIMVSSLPLLSWNYCIAYLMDMQDSLGERFGIQLYPGATSFLILPRKAGRAIAVAHILQSDESPGEDLGDSPSVATDKLQDRQSSAVDSARFEEQSEASLEESDGAARLEARLTSDVDKTVASHQLLEQYDYVLT